MKSILALSILGNVVLFSLVILDNHKHAPVAIPKRSLRSTNSIAEEKQQPASNDSSNGPWKALASGHYSDSISQLRSIGCPEKTIRDIVLYRMTREYYQKIFDLRAAPYQKKEWFRSFETPEEEWRRQMEMSYLRFELFERCSDLFGMSYTELLSDSSAWVPPIRGAWAPPEKIRMIDNIHNRFEQARAEIEGPPLPSDRVVLDQNQITSLAALQKRQRAELAELFTPEELAAYDLRYSLAAEYVQVFMPAPTSEAEYKRMVQIVQEAGVTKTGSMFEVEGGFEKIRDKIYDVIGKDRTAADQEAERKRNLDFETETEDNREQRDLNRMTAIGADMGITRPQVAEFKRQFESMFENWQSQMKDVDPAKLSEAEQHAIMDKMTAEAKRISTETMGPRGVEFLEAVYPEIKESGNASGKKASGAVH